MRLTQHGTIEVMGCKVRHTTDGKWLVSRSGIMVGEVDSLAEVEGLIERKNVEVREHLARIEAEHAARKEAREMMRATIEGASKPEEQPAPYGWTSTDLN